MPDLYIAENYEPLLSLRETERAIKFIKDFFQDNLAMALNLQRISAPVFLRKGSGVNDDLNGVEKPVRFPVKEMGGAHVELVQSLAKWKRLALHRYGYEAGEGIYTDMNAVRPDEIIDDIQARLIDPAAQILHEVAQRIDRPTDRGDKAQGVEG